MADHFRAGSYPNKYALYAGIVLPTSDSIRLTGFELGIIVDTSNLEDKPYVGMKQLRGLDGLAAQSLKVIEEALALYRLTCEDPEEESLRAFARTLLADTGSTQGWGEDHEYTQDVLEDFFWYRHYLSDWACGSEADAGEVTAQHVRYHVFPYTKNFPITWRNRCMFVTNNGRIGLGSRPCQPGDVVCIFFSAKRPFILRKVPSEDFLSCQRGLR